MKLVNYSRQLILRFVCGETFFLVVESVKELREIVDELLKSVQEENEDWILSEDEEIQKKGSLMEIIFSPWMIDVNNRRIQKGLLKQIIQCIQQGMEIDRVQHILSETRLLLDHINDELPLGFEYDVEDISEILKECNIRFYEERDLVTRLNQYMKICSEILGIRIFVFIGLKNYLTSEEIGVLAREAGYLGCCILCIESASDGTEKNLILIDKDLCRVV